ncbi:bifunctional [glutamine synthetase] adenylyltransferase/[glutamine synthetase]-adenylyl-L-tyrosine phosphorylase [Sphingosinicella sp.]|uniref:bifunctional [glutamine synthetase] adenylyltransferase/[glutamine synthetase]-adenylyl-L-tyrosine phosphorylase n=1 Tax=Sphingosinicella sp. TaxID=1917971 RepID=UPI004037D7B2
MNATVGLVEALARARAHSPFLRDLLDRGGPVAAALEAGNLGRALAAAGQGPDGDVMAALRRERSAHALALAIADLAGLMPLEEVTLALSNLADRTLDRAVGAAIAERTPDEAQRGFAVIALGKLGGRELNYSSDVDLIYLYDPETLPRRSAREEPGQAALRIGQRVTELLQQRTADGYAFRVDLRLRPSPEVTPIALPVEAAISYYESSALPWERAAFIRARAAAGDMALGGDFLDAIHPFVWRRSLDFGAIEEVQALTRRIRDHYAQGQAFGPGYDLKRGRGGIREIEFFAQIHQLIHGGRDPELRSASTVAALAALAEAGRVAAEEAAALTEAYRILRTIEHRLQMVDDRQTHALPADAAALDNVARLHGLAGGGDLIALLRPHVERVGALYDTLGAGGERRLPASPAALEQTLAAAGMADPALARLRIEGWRGGKARSLRTASAREAFEAMLPVLVDAFAAAPDPARAMNRFEDVIERLPSGVNFYRLLAARPGLTEHLGAILSHAPALADQLGRRPELLDGLIDARAFSAMPPVGSLAELFGRSDRADEDYQLVLDRVRRRVNEARFALGAQIVLGKNRPGDAAQGYARVAEAAIQVLATATIAEFERVHGRVPAAELAILAMGRLGGGALTHASDLDLIYLFSGDHEASSDGAKPLRATDYFNRLAPRVSAALSVATAAGPLYEVDTRLRPSGADGMLAVSIDTFLAYQRASAWTFEHMALTRARPVFGPEAALDMLAEGMAAILRTRRDPVPTRADAARMRSEVARHKRPRGPLDVKLIDGGLVDLEFAVQTLQLTRHAGLVPHFPDALGALIAVGLVPSEMDAHYRLLHDMLVVMRLVAPDSAEPPAASRALVAKACGAADWDELLARYAAARQSVRELWRAVAG